ncbi:aminoglycoside phosphotransferase family protein [Streptomyces sp. TG1A-8]|uniref:phosphotransferase family protein n=1 Tax=Streptomyces sp. TG1A-8 TaxID=3051385 RepID=UPI00265B8409|nr:aminoglycoside phosphotransferase family protein [Streptomyces sp. TG1A-8]MDO0925043.1 aminoglycoside phosphotransferase family protein [Streptomyces sp. TG1A-8]
MNASSGTEDGAARPWRLPGWRARTAAVVDAHLAAGGLRRTGPVEDVKRWTLSAVVRCTTTGGVVFHKQSLPSLAHEGRVLSALARQRPGLVPEVVAPAPSHQGWCTREVRLRPGTDLPHAARGLALAELGVVQRDWLGRTAELASLGCWSRTPDALAQWVPLALRDDLFGPGSGLPDALSAQEQRRLADACARLPALCAALAGAPPGGTLVHGDLHPGNWGVARATGRTVLLDWAEASIGHPFLDVAPALRSCPDPAAGSRALDRYFASWSPLLSRAECHEVWRIAEPVAVFNQIVTYARLFDETEPEERAGWAPRLLWWARRLPRTVGTDAPP